MTLRCDRKVRGLAPSKHGSKAYRWQGRRGARSTEVEEDGPIGERVLVSIQAFEAADVGC
jgi:hypothetical protein